MQFFDKRLSKRFRGILNDKINATEMVGGLNHIVNIDALSLKADRVRLKDIAGLVMREPAAFNMIGVVCHVDLQLVIDASAQLHFPLGLQSLQQRFRQGLPLVDPLRPLGVLGDPPGFSLEDSAGDTIVGTVIPHRALRHAPLCRTLGNRNHIHANHLK